MKKLYGIVSAMVTPFADDGSVDTAAIRKHVDYLISGGVDCLYPLGTTGEMFLQSVEERKKAAETLVDQNNGRLTAFIHVGAMNMADTIELAVHARSIGADGVGVVTPAFFKLNDREMEEFYVGVANSLPEDFPVYLYNIPQLSANDLTPEVVERILKRTANVVGIKYSFADMARTQAYLKVNGGNFSVLHGADTLLSSMLMMGCEGTVSGCSCIWPAPFVNVYKAWKSGNIPEIQKRQKIASDFVTLVRGGSNMAYFKTGLKIQGVDMGHMRAPLRDLTDSEREPFEKDFREFIEKFGE